MSTCAIVAASPEFNAQTFRQQYDAGAFDYVIAADGGLAHLEAAGVKPDLVMGDFDSLGYTPRGIRTVKFPTDKDKSDMEICLERARTLRHTKAVVFGALGGRADHALANMQVFTGASQQGMKIVAVGASFAIHFLTGPDIFEAPAQMEGTVSVFSLTDTSTGVFERGLKWELDDATLTNCKSRGLSNELIGEAVMIGVEQGTIAVFFPL